MNAFIWLALISSLSLLLAFPKIEWLKKRTIPIFLASFILRLAYTIGIEPTLAFIGTLNVRFCLKLTNIFKSLIKSF